MGKNVRKSRPDRVAPTDAALGSPARRGAGGPLLVAAGAVSTALWLGEAPALGAQAGFGFSAAEASPAVAGRVAGQISDVAFPGDGTMVVWLGGGARLTVPDTARRSSEPVRRGDDLQAAYRMPDGSEGEKVVTELLVVPHIEAP